MTALLLALALHAWLTSTEVPMVHGFSLTHPSEVLASITASCAQCDWGAAGREGVLLEVLVDGMYSQHVVLTGMGPASHRIVLGRLEAGEHHLLVRQDAQRSAAGAGRAQLHGATTEAFGEHQPEYSWLSHAPFLRTRPSSLEHFSDVPLLMYAERDVTRGEGGNAYRVQYTVIFSNEDGGTPADRLLATWGRTSDIEFVFGVAPDGSEIIQGEGHRWIAYRGGRTAGHPELWVSTDNNMVADHGASSAIRVSLAPELVDLGGRAREAVADTHPWIHRVAAAEVHREGRVAIDAPVGTGRIVDPRRYVTVEACADVVDATVAFDVGALGPDRTVVWYATDGGHPAFRVARSGCFRASAALPAGFLPSHVVGLRARAYAAPAPERSTAPAVTIRRVNLMHVLDAAYSPVRIDMTPWVGSLPVPPTGSAVEVR